MGGLTHRLLQDSIMFNRGYTGFFRQGWKLPGYGVQEDAGVDDLGKEGFGEAGLGVVVGKDEFVGSFDCVVEVCGELG